MNVAETATSTPSRVNRQQLMQQARIWVNQTFFGVLLKQMHDSPFKSELFSGGRGGQVFASLLDQHLTQRIGSSGPGEALANSIVKRIERAHPHLFRETDQSVRGVASSSASSPILMGEGRGEGSSQQQISLSAVKNPHPVPLPEYRERGNEAPPAITRLP